jgi:hypothetical protein
MTTHQDATYMEPQMPHQIHQSDPQGMHLLSPFKTNAGFYEWERTQTSSITCQCYSLSSNEEPIQHPHFPA